MVLKGLKPAPLFLIHEEKKLIKKAYIVSNLVTTV